MMISIRHPAAPGRDWNEEIHWPDGWRVPDVGELVSIDRGQFRVEDVQWFNEIEDGKFYQAVQLIVR